MRKLIFVADDYDHLSDLIADRIRRETRWETLALKDGDEVLFHAETRRPDVCILDLDMPKIGGEEAARKLRLRFPVQCPFLIGLSGEDSWMSPSDAPVFDRVLRKPIDMDVLFKLLRPK